MSTDIVLMLYTILAMFVLLMSYKIFKYKTGKKTILASFNQQRKITTYILLFLIVWMMFLEMGIYLKIILLIISIYFIYVGLEKVEISDQGIYHNGRFIAWDNLKKWSFDEKKGTLFTQGKDNKTNVVFFTRIEDKEAISNLIKENKK